MTWSINFRDRGAAKTRHQEARTQLQKYPPAPPGVHCAVAPGSGATSNFRFRRFGNHGPLSRESRGARVFAQVGWPSRWTPWIGLCKFADSQRLGTLGEGLLWRHCSSSHPVPVGPGGGRSVHWSGLPGLVPLPGDGSGAAPWGSRGEAGEIAQRHWHYPGLLENFWFPKCEGGRVVG